MSRPHIVFVSAFVSTALKGSTFIINEDAPQKDILVFSCRLLPTAAGPAATATATAGPAATAATTRTTA